MTTQATETRGGNLMAGTWTAATKVRRAFKSGRPRKLDLAVTPKRAILEGSIVLHQLQTAMETAGLSGGDVKAALVLVADIGCYALRIPEAEDLADAFRKVRQLTGEWRPLGLVFAQLDREADPKNGAAFWTQPWLVGPESARLLIEATKEIARGNYGLHRMD